MHKTNYIRINTLARPVAFGRTGRELLSVVRREIPDTSTV